METELFDGEYFIQKIQWRNLRAEEPAGRETLGIFGGYSPEARELLEKEGPKYQYGRGCLSDGVLGQWMALVCGVGQVLDASKVASISRPSTSTTSSTISPTIPIRSGPPTPAARGGACSCSWPKGGHSPCPSSTRTRSGRASSIRWPRT